MSLRSGYGATSTQRFGLPGLAPSAPSYRPPQIKQATDTTRPGGFAFDFTDPAGSVEKSIQSGGRLVGSAPGGDILNDALGAVGGVLGGVADFLVPGDLGIGDIATGAGEVLGYLNTERNKAAARDRINTALGRSSGITDDISIAFAKIGQSLLGPGDAELRAAGWDGKSDPTPLFRDPNFRARLQQSRDDFAVPADILARARSGESVDALAQEMADKGIGTSSNAAGQLGADILGDPLNIVSFGLSKVGQAGKLAKVGGEAADKLNPVMRASGLTYNALVGNGSRAVKTVVSAAIGPATSGVVRAYGAARYASVLRTIASESPEMGRLAKEYLDINHTQVIRATIGKVLGKQWSPIVRELKGGPGEIEAQLQNLVKTLPESSMVRKQIEEAAADLIRRVKPSFIGQTDDAVRAEAYQILTDTLLAPVSVAAKLIGKQTGDKLRETAAILHGMRYGKAVKDFVQLRDEVLPLSRSASRALQTERLTPIAHGTLTDKRIQSALNDIVTEADEALAGAPGLTPAGAGAKGVTIKETYDAEAVRAAVERYDDLAYRFLGTQYTPEQVVRYLRTLQKSDNIVEELTSGLPAALRTWADDYGYGVGYAPKSGWKATIDAEGNLEVGDAFVHVQAGITPTHIRNPIGRLGDSLFASIHQRQLVLTSETRLADFMVKKGIGSEKLARGIHRAALREAVDRNVTPRALVTLPAKDPKRYANRVQEIFAEHLGDEYADFIKVANPEFAFFRALQGKFSEVGYSQALTGSLKAAEAKFGTHFLVNVTEGLYPKARFSWNPFFQTQERVETEFWKVARGVIHRDMDPEVRDAIVKAVEGTYDGKIFEEFGAIFLHKGRVAAQQIAEKSGVVARVRAIGRSATDVAGTKQEATVQQVFGEYAEHVEKAITEIDPNLWRRMVEEAGTTDARTVVEEWVKQHQALLKEADAEIAIEQARKAAKAAYESGDFERGVALDMQAKSLAGGTAESGGAIRAARAPVKWDADTETIWQAWRYGIQRASQVARQTQYFREGRGWLERGLNHPFLGLYPLSYASKVFMEFGRFLLKRPFGLDAPLIGAASMNKFQQALLTAMEDEDTGLAKFVEANPIALNFINQMLPYWPTNVAVNAPLWVKDIAAQAERGKGIPESRRTAKNANVTVQDIGKAILEQSKLYLAAPLRLPLEVLPGSIQQATDSILGEDQTLGGAR